MPGERGVFCNYVVTVPQTIDWFNTAISVQSSVSLGFLHPLACLFKSDPDMPTQKEADIGKSGPKDSVRNPPACRVLCTWWYGFTQDACWFGYANFRCKKKNLVIGALDSPPSCHTRLGTKRSPKSKKTFPIYDDWVSPEKKVSPSCKSLLNSIQWKSSLRSGLFGSRLCHLCLKQRSHCSNWRFLKIVEIGSLARSGKLSLHVQAWLCNQLSLLILSYKTAAIWTWAIYNHHDLVF